jgi:hypothetical protein
VRPGAQFRAVGIKGRQLALQRAGDIDKPICFEGGTGPWSLPFGAGRNFKEEQGPYQLTLIWPAGGYCCLVGPLVVNVKVSGMVREESLWAMLGDKGLYSLYNVQQVYTVHPIIGVVSKGHGGYTQDIASFSGRAAPGLEV